MTGESTSDRQELWVLVVRRSFEIPDQVDNKDAREVLIGHLLEQLQENEWPSPLRATAQPIVDALMALGASGDIDDQLLSAGLGLSTLNTRDVARRVLGRAMTVADPERLVFDALSDFPPEVVAATQQMLDRVCQYVSEQPFGG
jgi:hypothetical protein